MENELNNLETVLGEEIERRDSRVIPGALSVSGQEVVYFSDDKSNSRRSQFQRLTRQINPPLLKSGGASERGCTIWLPDGTQFHAMSYHGDIAGWRRQIAQGALELGVLTAIISDDKLMISDGREVSLSECRVEFD